MSAPQEISGERASSSRLTLPPLPPTASRSGLVAESIREAILHGELKPGQTLVERRLAEMLGVSKTPVREALLSLASTGLVTVNVNRGVTVRSLELHDVFKLYQLRLLLEPWAMAWGDGQHGGMKHETAKQVLTEAAVLLESNDHAALSLANRSFHRSMYSTCKNELVVAQLDQVQDLVALAVSNVLWPRWPTWTVEHDEHCAILKAAERGQRERIEVLAREHIERNLARLHEQIG